ncbi:hypothetical protein PAHAL_1G210200 [Panicum hallii]|uniref:Uncharacterized protein n=1 Tax=Panicum hallii TaxID=206008 RepID=A0A2S3GPF4_9POAL|nr:hypothetical protein PAHAL_1G210200 [Panicum hallii]
MSRFSFTHKVFDSLDEPRHRCGSTCERGCQCHIVNSSSEVLASIVCPGVCSTAASKLRS